MNMLKKIQKPNERGTALFMTIMMLAGILTVSLGAANLIVPGLVMSRVQNYSTKAYFAAEAGAERVLWEVRKNNYVVPDVNTANIFTGSLGNASAYDVDYATSSPIITMTANGIYSGSRRSIELQYQ